MATSSPSSTTQLEHSLRCSVCLDVFKEPKVLPCCHTFCKECLKRILNSDSRESSESQSTSTEQPNIIHGEEAQEEGKLTLTCPQCRAHSTLPEGGVDALLTNFAIGAEFGPEDTPSLQREIPKQCSLCESESDPAINYCDDCSFLLCDVCSKAHHRQKQYRGHTVRSVDEVDSSLLTVTQRHGSGLVCPKHSSQTPQIYCESCDVLVCCECIIEGHEGHTFVGINTKTRCQVEEKLSVTSSAAREMLQTFRENHEYVVWVEKVTSDMGAKLKEDINETFESFITALKQRRDKLLARSEENCVAKLKALWSERDDLERTIAKFSTALEFVERSQKCKNDGEFLSLASQVLLRLKELEHSSWKSTTVVEIESSYLRFERKVNEPKVFRSACRFEEVKNSLSVVQWKEFPSHVSLGTEHKAVMCITTDNGRHPTILDGKPSVVIRHRQSATCNVADVKIARSTTLPGAWDVTFTPYCGGTHTCEISAWGVRTLSTLFDVTGVPSIGSRVMRGPSWKYCTLSHCYGEAESDIAIVQDHTPSQEYQQTVSVVWQDKKSFMYRWNDEGKFDIQLFH